MSHTTESHELNADPALTTEVLSEALKGIPAGCWHPQHVDAFVMGTADLSDKLLQHLYDCTRCQAVLIARCS